MRAWRHVLTGAALALGACGGSTPATPDADTFISCANDPRVEAIAAGTEKAGASNLLKLTLMSFDPTPPHKGNNSWTVRVTDAQGGAQAGATMQITTWMPDHKHGSTVKPAASPAG